jgi:ketosteroid isomerase-like protein
MTGPRDEQIRAAYEHFAAADFDAALRLFSPDATYVNPAAALMPGTRQGIDEVAAALRSIHEEIDFDRVDVLEIAEGRGCLLVTLRVVGRGRMSGAPIDELFNHVLRFEGEQVVAFEWYSNLDEATRAAGSPSD